MAGSGLPPARASAPMRQRSVKTIPLPAKRRRAFSRGRLSAPHRRALERTSARLPADVSGIAPYMWGLGWPAGAHWSVFER